ncbi:MAG TPA: GcrA family cell cycle regulator [Candidatus Paceibacterota bacterium]
MVNDGWTQDRVSTLKKLWLEGQSATEISRQLGAGITRNAVIGKVHRLGLSGRATPSQPARTTFSDGRSRVKKSTQNRPAQKAATRPPATSSDPAPRVEDEPVLPDLSGTAVLGTLSKHMCRWPIGDPASSDFSFCGRKSDHGPYCIEHGRVAFQPLVRSAAKSLEHSAMRYV